MSTLDFLFVNVAIPSLQTGLRALGVLAIAAQVGNALGVSVIGIVASGALAVAPRPAQITHAFGHGLIYLIGVGIAVAIATQLLPRNAPEAG